MSIKPGDKCKIINSVNGPSGLSVGRTVIVRSFEAKSEYDEQYAEKWNQLNDPFHYCPPTPYEKMHSTLGQIWPVSCVNGGTFVSEHGGIGLKIIDVPEIWLRKIDEPPPLVTTTSDRLELEDK